MNRRTTLKTVGSIVGTGVLAPGIVSADETWAREETKRFFTHQEVQEFLEDVGRRARTRYELEEIGESLEGRALSVARVGEGDTDVFFTAEQHGNEPTGTNAILAELRELATSGTPFARQVREALTVHILPMHNPDGAMRNQRTNADGVDPNRQHDYEVGSSDNPSPETQAMIDYVVPLEPLRVADLH
ncbi:M14 family zinc carboxypeptidase, partial [Natronococcus sp.]|uniref:M14 family zinc carboxypeptidase n=1 Tax=Natronococcus sp. TaxID=35747 RepID=UPI003A4DB032